MNYIKLNLGGKERGAKLGLLFLENVQKAENKNIEELYKELEERTIFFAPKLLYYAFQTNCQLNGENQDFTLADVYDWVEEDGVSRKDGAVMTFINAFSQSVTKLFPSDNTPIEQGKPKPTKRASTPTSGSKK